MNKQSIPELAEQLRHHINTDNDAKRLICEYVLPLVGIDVTPKEATCLNDRIETLEDKLSFAVDNLRSDINRHSEVIPEEALDSLKQTLEAITLP